MTTVSRPVSIAARIQSDQVHHVASKDNTAIAATASVASLTSSFYHLGGTSIADNIPSRRAAAKHIFQDEPIAIRCPSRSGHEQPLYPVQVRQHYPKRTPTSPSSIRLTPPNTPLTLPPTRPAATTTVRSADAHDILVKQRLNRPVSPHLSIYKPQITWYGSALNRITGSVLSGGFYAFGAAYLVAPLFGWHLESASMAAAFGAWPVALKVAAKFTVAFPFTFHGLNGVRHLVWDMGRELSNKQVQRTGWAVVGLSVTGAAVLAMV